MLAAIINFIFGYVDFTFCGGFSDGFINDCYLRKIRIRRIIVENGALSARCTASAYHKLRPVARLHGGRLRITKKRGLPFLLYPLKNRFGVFCGMLFFVMFVSFMGGFIWNIKVVGNNTLSEAKIVDYLAQNGFAVGRRWADTDKENLEYAVLADFDEVAWISINKFGCLAQVEIRETTPKPDIENNNIVTNVVAEKDGVIVRVTALGGWQTVKPGDAVTAGDLLISGVYDGEENNLNHFARAHGTVTAKTETAIEVNIPREQSVKNYLSEKEYKTLYFFALKIPLYITENKENAQTDFEKSFVTLNSFRLPIGIYTETCKYYSEVKTELSDDELKKLAESELEKRKSAELSDCEILGESLDFEITDSGCCLTAEFSLLEDIGAEKVLTFTADDDANSKANNAESD